MYDSGKIIPGLIIFLILITFPIWHNLARGTATYQPQPKLPVEAKVCVAETQYMRAAHMDMLNQWRDDVVRKNDRFTTGLDGNRYEKSLSHTCIKCHANKQEFCDSCHNYVGVSPYCWECHVEPKEVKR